MGRGKASRRESARQRKKEEKRKQKDRETERKKEVELENGIKVKLLTERPVRNKPGITKRFIKLTLDGRLVGLVLVVIRVEHSHWSGLLRSCSH